MDGGAWWAAVHRVVKSRTRLHFHFHFSLLCIGEGNGNPLQCSCLENPRVGGAWWAAIYGVAQSWTRLKRLSSSSIQREQKDEVDVYKGRSKVFYIYILYIFTLLKHIKLLHSVSQALGSSTSLELTQMCSFLWLSNIPLCICTTTYLSFHLLMDIQVASMFQLL